MASERFLYVHLQLWTSRVWAQTTKIYTHSVKTNETAQTSYKQLAVRKGGARQGALESQWSCIRTSTNNAIIIIIIRPPVEVEVQQTMRPINGLFAFTKICTQPQWPSQRRQGHTHDRSALSFRPIAIEPSVSSMPPKADCKCFSQCHKACPPTIT